MNLKSIPRHAIARSLQCISLLMLLAGCATGPKADPQFIPNFFIEARGSELRNPRVTSVQLPISASVIQIKPVPSIPHFDLQSVQLKQGTMGPYLEFALNPESRLRLMELSGTYRSRRLVLVVGSEPLGAWRIDRIIEDGTLAIHVEVDEGELPTLVQNIQNSLRAQP